MSRFLWLLTPVFFITSIIQLIAIDSYFAEHLHWNGFVAFIAALILTWFPILGSLAGILGAVMVWHWDILFAILLFIWPTLLFFNDQITYNLITRFDSTIKKAKYIMRAIFIEAPLITLKIIEEIVTSKVFIYTLIVTISLFFYATYNQQQQLLKNKQNYAHTPSLSITENTPTPQSKTNIHDDKSHFNSVETKIKQAPKNTTKSTNKNSKPKHKETPPPISKQREIIDVIGTQDGKYSYFTTALWDGLGQNESDFTDYAIEKIDNANGKRSIIAKTEHNTGASENETILNHLILSNDGDTLFFHSHTLNTPNAIYSLDLHNKTIRFIAYGDLVCQVKHKNFDGNYKNELVIVQHGTNGEFDKSVTLYTPQGERLGIIGGNDTTKRELSYFCTSVDNSAFK
ncbi:hypothetical protein IDQ04_002239 [Salmonella enterica]|nr:hypothetical protein [Salmonella enterica]EHE4380876.1 hypothetical protein [Salmonella enterica]